VSLNFIIVYVSYLRQIGQLLIDHHFFVQVIWARAYLGEVFRVHTPEMKPFLLQKPNMPKIR